MSSPPDHSLTGVLLGYARLLSDESVPLATRIQMAAEVWQAQDLSLKVLEPLKVALRAYARTQDPTGNGVVVIPGEGATSAEVSMFPLVKVSPDLTVEEAKQILGPDFDRVFKVVITPRPTALKVLEELGPRVQRRLFQWVSVSDGTPRVSIKAITGDGVEP